MGSLPDLHALAAMDRPVVGRMQPWDDCMLELAACPSPASSRLTACRLQPHRDSLCSSGGASSVRRLITTVRSAPPTLGPSYPRRLLLRNHAALCLGQLACKASLSPLLPLFPWWPLPEAGVLLLVALCSTAALSSLLAPAVLRYLGAARTLLLCHLVGCAFLAAHFAPVPASLVPAYLVMGTSLGPLAVARVTQLTSISCRLSAFDGAPELAGLTRGLQLAQDGGLLLGNAIAASLLHWADHSQTSADTESECGSSSCPEPENLASVDVGCRAGPLLAGALLGLTAAGTAITATCLDRFPQPLTPPPSAASLLKDSRLLLAMPITIFMGLEQGFMMSDFSKWYVACVLSLTSISLAFVSLVVLQCVAAFTLSLVLPHIQRYLAVGVGAAFHACLLLVLLLWQPSQDDAALFYVISAAWGVCNAVWETLTLTYILSVYADCWQTPYALSHSFYWLGLGLAFGVHASLCVWLKLYVLSAALILGVASYAWLEYKIGAKAAEAL